MHVAPLSMMAVMVALSALCGCQDDKQSYVANVGDGETTPTMLTTPVNTYISDSGYTRYHITAPVWGMYDEAKEPFWRFPEGLELEQYDRQFRPSSYFRCDSAMYLTNKRIWQFDGNVVMVNIQRDTFLTQQVFWDQGAREVSSDSFIHIVRADRIIEGYGFNSNEQMTEYSVNRPTAIFPVERRPGAQRATPTDSDSVAVGPHQRPQRRRPSDGSAPGRDTGVPSNVDGAPRLQPNGSPVLNPHLK